MLLFYLELHGMHSYRLEMMTTMLINNPHCFWSYRDRCSKNHKACAGDDCEDKLQTCYGCKNIEKTIFMYNKNTRYMWCKMLNKWRINTGRGCEYYESK